MPIDNRKLKKLWDTLRSGGYTEDYKTFATGFSGNGNYDKRKELYDLLKETGDTDAKDYGEFMSKLHTDTPIRRTPPAPKPTPMEKLAESGAQIGKAYGEFMKKPHKDTPQHPLHLPEGFGTLDMKDPMAKVRDANEVSDAVRGIESGNAEKAAAGRKKLAEVSDRLEREKEAAKPVIDLSAPLTEEQKSYMRHRKDAADYQAKTGRKMPSVFGDGIERFGVPDADDYAKGVASNRIFVPEAERDENGEITGRYSITSDKGAQRADRDARQGAIDAQKAMDADEAEKERLSTTEGKDAEIADAEKRIKEIDAKMAARRRKLGIPQGGALGIAMNVAASADEEYNALSAARRQEELRLRSLEDRRFGGGDDYWWQIFRGAQGAVEKFLGYDLASDLAKYRAAGAASGFDKDVDEARQMFMESQYKNEREQAIAAESGGLAREFGQLTGNSAVYMLPFMFGGKVIGGMQTLSRAAMRGTVKTAAGQAARKGVAAALGRYTKRALGAVAEDMAIGLTGASTVGLPATLGQAAENYAGKLEQDENGRYYYTGGDETAHALVTALLSNSFEYSSEMAGEHMESLWKAGKKSFAKTRLGMSIDRLFAPSKDGNRLVRYYNGIKSGAEAWLERLRKTKAGSAAYNVADFMTEGSARMFKHAHIQGLPFEGLEEELNNIENAAFQTGQGCWEDVADNEQRWKLWAGLAISMATTGAVFGGISTVQYGGRMAGQYRAKHLLDRADVIARYRMTEEVWQPIKDELDNADNADMGKVIAKALGTVKTDQERKEILNYARRLLEYRGYNIATTVGAAQGDGGADSGDMAYSEGYETTDANDMHGIKTRYEEARGKIEADGVNPDETDVREHIEMMLGARNEDGTPYYTDGEVQPYIDYLNAKAAFDGSLERVRDDIDSGIAESDAAVDRRTGKDGMVHPAVMKQPKADGTERSVYILGGNVEFTGDGGVVIDPKDTRGSIVVCGEDGTMEMVSPDAIREVGDAIDPEAEKEEAAEAVRQRIAQDAADKFDNTPKYGVNDTFVMTGADGTPVSGVVQRMDDDGVEAAIGDRVALIPTEQFEAAVQEVRDAYGNVAWRRTPEDAAGTDVQENVESVPNSGESVQETPENAPQDLVEEQKPDAAVQENGNSDAVGRSLSESETETVISEMKSGAQPAPEMELNPENWLSQFGEDGVVATPIGEVRMGENQYFKLAQRGRDGKLGMVKPTLESPDVIVEDAGKAKENDAEERPSSYVFVKTFTKADGSRYYHFTSVTVSKDGGEVVVSNQEKSENRISRLLRNGRIVWIDAAFSLHPTAQDGVSVPLGDSNRLTPTDSQSALLGVSSPEHSAGKDTEQNPDMQADGVENASALSRIPKDGNGEPVYTAADAYTAWDALVEQCGGDSGMAQGVADSMVKDMEDALKKAEKSAPAHGVTVAEKIAAAKGHKAAVEKARTELEKWRAIAGETASRARAAEEAERRRKKERLDAAREELRRNGRYAKEDAALGDYTDFADYAMRTIATGKYRFLWGDRESGTQGLGAHLGFTGSRTERNKRIWLLSKDGFTPEEAAERMLADYSAAAGFDSVEDTGVDSMEALDVILDILLRYTSPRAMMDDAKAAHAENGESAEERRQGEEYERGQFMEAYHMTPEEYYEYENEWLPRYMEEATQVPQEVIDNINAEYAEKYSENGKDDYNGGEDARGVPPVQGERADKPGGDEGGGDTGGAAGAVGEGDDAGGLVPQGAPGGIEGDAKPTLGDVIGTLYKKGKETASELFQRSFMDVAETPDFMKRLGMTGAKFTIRYGVIARHFGKDGSHNLTEAEWMQLPEALQKPFAIASLSDREKAYRLYTSLKTEKGEYVVVGVDVKNAGRDMEVNSIATVFGRREGAGLPGNESVIYRSDAITPEQEALLGRPNSDQYPSARELSGRKVTEESADLQENGGKDAESKAERLAEADKERKARIMSDGTLFDRPFGLVPPKEIRSADDIMGNMARIVRGLAEHEGELGRKGETGTADHDGPLSGFDGWVYGNGHVRNAQEQVSQYLSVLNDVLPKGVKEAWLRSFAPKTRDESDGWVKDLYGRYAAFFAAAEHTGDVEQEWEDRIADYIYEHYPTQAVLSGATASPQGLKERGAMREDPVLKKMREDADAAFAEADAAASRLFRELPGERREGKPFEFGKELEEAKRQFEEYSEAMKKEMEEKEKKNASGGSSDIGPEPERGKQNGTAPLQDNSSDGKVTNNQPTLQENGEEKGITTNPTSASHGANGSELAAPNNSEGKDTTKSETEEVSTSGKAKGKEEGKEKIDDVGERIEGARKDAMKKLSEGLEQATEAALVALPFSKAFKRPDLKKAVENGVLREGDAMFAQAVMSAYLSSKKPLLSKSGSRYKKEQSEEAVKEWARNAYKGVELLKKLFSLSPSERDAFMSEEMNRLAYDPEKTEAYKRKLSEWNPGKVFNGTCYPLNAIKVWYDVYTQLGYEAGTGIPQLFSDVTTDFTYTGYILKDAKGKPFYPARTLDTYDAVVNEIVYQIKVANADTDTGHPKEAFRLESTGAAIKEPTGKWRVVTQASLSARPIENVFNSKEEAEKFAKAYMENDGKKAGKYRYASAPAEMMTITGFSEYAVVLKRENVGKGTSTYFELKRYGTKEEATAAIDAEYEELNELANKALAKEKEDKGGKSSAKRPVCSIEAYTEDGKTWKYGVALSEKYAPKKSAFSTMPYYLADGFATREDAQAYLDAHREEIEAKAAEVDEKRRNFKYFKGSGERVGKDYRNGGDVTAEQFREQFGFRGVQFGNWTDQGDRQEAINQAFDAFMDLSRILGVSPKALSLDGELGIAFGARGSGKAAAHYEPAQVVINLTKTNGAGSLAHEWWHALDNYFARQGNVAMGHVTASKSIEMREELRRAFNALIDHLDKSPYNERSRQKGTSYWGTPMEETARMFEQWVNDQLAQRGERSPFLTDADPNAEERYVEYNYAVYEFFMGDKAMPYEEFKQTPQALAGFVYLTRDELQALGEDLKHIFDTIQQKVDETTGKTLMYHRGDVVAPLTSEERVLRDAVVDRLREGGMDVITDVEEGRRVLDMADDARMEAKVVSPRRQWLNSYVEAMHLATGRDKKAIRAEVEQKIADIRKETKELYGRVLSGNFDDVTLQLINNYIDNFTPYNEYWRPLSKRLPSKALRSLRKRERANSVDVLFSRISESAVPKNGRTGAEAKRRVEEKKEELLKKWAVATGNWHTDVSDFEVDETPIGSGKDSVVYQSKDGKTVIKASKGKFDNRKFPTDVDQVALFNYVFPESRYEILGYGEVGGKFVKFLRQRAVDFSTPVPLTAEERTEYMRKLGFEPGNEEKTVFSNGEIVVSDLQNSNIVRDKAGNIRVIDADVKLHTRDIGGNYTYPDVETDTEKAETVREQRVYHGSGADFDAFDHSHMGEGEGAQAYGWGTYVTEVEGIGRTYAERNSGRNWYAIQDQKEIIRRHREYISEAADDGKWAEKVKWAKENIPDIKQSLDAAEKAGDETEKRLRQGVLDILNEWLAPDGQKKEIDRYRDAIAKAEAKIDELQKAAPRNLYTVEIPDDNGGNYLDWNAMTGSELNARIKEALRADEGLNELYEGRKSELNADLDEFAPRVPFYETYTQICELLGSAEAASKFLSSLGFVGIKYPADNMRGGRADGAKNYVIFNEKDARITDHVRFFRTAEGEAYGFTVGGKIYIDPKIAKAETPVHEYAHLWASALKAGNAKEWDNVVGLMKGTPVWDEVKRRYPELETDDEIADEVIATYSGRRGAERLREEARRITGGSGSVFEKAEAVSALGRVKAALDRFWKAVADFLHIHYTSAGEVADRVMKDLLDGVDPGKFGKGGVAGELRFNARQKRALETATWQQRDVEANQATVVSSADGAKIIKELDSLANSLDEKDSNRSKTFIGDVARAIGAKEKGSSSQYATFETKNGRIVTIRLANHNASSSKFDNAGRNNAISIVITNRNNEGIRNDGNAHIVEFYYNKGKLIKAEGKPLAEIVRSIRQALYSGEFRDTTGLAEVQEVNAGDAIRFQFTGERGAEAADRAEEVTVRLDNLSVAREMEKSGKDAKAVKMATGWERGADGKWRYETGDVSLWDGLRLTKRGTEERTTFGEMLEDSREKEELLAAYPQLKAMPLVFKDMGYGEVGYYDGKEIVLNSYLLTDDSGRFTENASSVLAHEIQHAIQHIEGFSMGATPEEMRSRKFGRKYEDYLYPFNASQLNDLRFIRSRAEGYVKSGKYKRMHYAVLAAIKESKEHGLYPAWAEADEYMDFYAREALQEVPSEIMIEASLVSENEAHAEYMRKGGEVEARNVQRRIGMTPEERRASLAAETEDVAREDQIFLERELGGAGASMEEAPEERTDKDLERVNEEFNERLDEWQEGTLNASDYLDAGLPNGIIAQFMPDAPIIIRQKVLRKSAKKHGLSASDMKDLPKAMRSPIFIFKSSESTISILTELKSSEGRNIFVAVELGKEKQMGHRFIEVNDILTIHGRETENVINPIVENDSLVWADKEKGLNWLSSAKSKSQAIANEVLDTAANVVRNFENPKVSDEKMAEKEKKYAEMDASVEAATDVAVDVEDDTPGGDAKFRSMEMDVTDVADEERDAMTARVNELAERLHTPVRIIRTDGEVAALPSARQRGMKGSFNPMTGEVTVVIPNNADVADVENTVLHEVVGHGGLRVLFETEEKLNNALDELYRVSKDGIQESIDRMARKMYDAEVNRLMKSKRKAHEAKGENADAYYYTDLAEAHVEADRKRGQFRRNAAEEYAADLAGRIGEKGFERMSAEELTFWGRLKAVLQNALRKLAEGLGIPGVRKWGDNEWAFVLHEAYKRKRNGGKPSVADAADTVVAREGMGFEGMPGYGATENERFNEELDKVNKRFNEQLEELTNGVLPKGHVFKLGKPSEFLRAAGIPNLLIELPASQLSFKASSGKHDFDLKEVRDLPKAIANPIATFAYGDRDKAQNILTMLEHDGEKFLAGIFIRPTVKGQVLEVNSIRNVFPKNSGSIVRWILEGKLTNADKKKLLAFLDQQRTNYADVAFVLPEEQAKQGKQEASRNAPNHISSSAPIADATHSQELSSAAKVVENFENTKVSDEKAADGELYRTGDVKAFRDGRGIEFRRKPTATFNALLAHLEKEGVKAERHKARTGSEYASFSRYGVMYEVRNADHTKPRSAYDRANETGVEVTDWDGMIRHIDMDLVQARMNAADVYALMDEAERFNSEDEAVRRAATEDGVGSAEFRDAYPTLWRVMGLKSLEEARMEHLRKKYADEYYTARGKELDKLYPFTASNGVTIGRGRKFRVPKSIVYGKGDARRAAEEEFDKAYKKVYDEFIPLDDFVRQREQEGNLEEVNRRFNGQLDELTEENADEVRLELGMPNRILKASGIPGKPMVLYGNKIIKKANKHGFAPTDIKNLPKVLQSPIAVFEGSHKDSFAILTEMSIGGKKCSCQYRN